MSDKKRDNEASEFAGYFQTPSRTAGIDQLLAEYSARHQSVYALTSKHQAANWLPLPVESGTRVTIARNLGNILSYESLPASGEVGTVVKVRSSSLGDITSFEGQVFVKWDGGLFGQFHHEHLRVAAPATDKKANKVPPVRKIVRTAFDLDEFLRSAAFGEEDLVHKATRDLWSFRKEDSGGFVIERLFKEDGSPLKV